MGRGIIIVTISLILAGCSEAPTPEFPWQGYGTNRKSGHPEFFFPQYKTRNDCLFATEKLVEDSVHTQWYRAPYGCLYGGYQNAYVQYAVNVVLETEAFRCVARRVQSRNVLTAKEEGGSVLYFPVLKTAGPDKGENWYCVVSKK